MKIGVVTGTRAEYGMLQPVMAAIKAEPGFELCLFVTGAHLSPRFGSTWLEIADDGFVIDEKIEIPLDDDSAAGVAKATGAATSGFAQAFERRKPDIVVLLGDRFELLAAAQAALIEKIPVAHISGGDTTEGAFDEAIRHAITKMSHLHFVSNATAAARVRQLGEDPARITISGLPSLDRIRTMKLLRGDELGRAIGFPLRARNLLITFHPATLDSIAPAAQFGELLDALDRLDPDVGLIFTMPNADPENGSIADMIGDYVTRRPASVAHASLGHLRYLSALRAADAVVGNSSSGLIEAPAFGTPAVNIGDRQKGRVQAQSVTNVPANATAIYDAIRQALQSGRADVTHPYGDGRATERIIGVLKKLGDPRILLKKHFHDLKTEEARD